MTLTKCVSFNSVAPHYVIRYNKSLEAFRHMDNSKNSAMKELWDFARTRKKFWLLPLVLVLVTLGLLLFLIEGSAISPFVYTLF